METLIDTNVIIALRNEQDSLHVRAKDLVRRLENIIITDYVFDELINVLTRRQNKSVATQVGSWILRSDAELAKVSPDDFFEAWNIFSQYNNLSFTDATNIAVMKSLGITHIATFDEAFKKIPGIEVIS